MNVKLKKICQQLKKEHLDCLLLNSSANISYLTDYPARDSYLMVSASESVFLTDSRYTEEAKKSLKAIRVEQVDGQLFKKISDICRKQAWRCVGFEERSISFAEYTRLRKELPNSLGLAPTYGMVEKMRQVKSGAEISTIRKATRITIQAFRFARKLLKPGMKEVEVAGQLQRFIRYKGASGSAFDIIVASGPHTSYPHHITSERKLKENEPVLIDLGVEYQGYKSDLTRVVFLGKMKPSVQEVYSVVKEAKRLAIKAIRPGKTAGEIDSIARDYIALQGYGEFFGHGLGHGIGLQVHEEPHIGKKQTTTLESGMVFTVEPAVYLPGKFGIRLEDMVLVTKKGSEVLSGTLDQ